MDDILKKILALDGVVSGLSSGLRTEGLLVRFPGRAHAWDMAESPIGGAQEATTH